MANKSVYLKPFSLTVNGSVVADNSKYLVGMYTSQPSASISTFDFENGEFGYITCSETVSNTLYIFVMSTEAVRLDESFDYESWIYSSFGCAYYGDMWSSDIDDIKDSYSPMYSGQLDNLTDYNLVCGWRVGILDLPDNIEPDELLLVGGSSAVEITYESGEEYTATPSSPISVGETDVNLVVTLIDGYVWGDDSQTITIDGNTIEGVISENTCTFTLNSGNVGSGGVLTWGLDFEIYVPPATDRHDFFTVYIPTNENMEVINNAIFLNGTETVDVMHYFSSYKKFFCIIPIDGYKQLKASNYDFGVTSPYTKSYTLNIDCGSIQIDETFKSVMDYTPFSRLTIFLPFIGFQELDVSMVMNNVLHVVYTVDVLSGRCLAKLFVVIEGNECCIAEYGGTIASDEVFSSSGQYNGSYELMTSMQLGDLQTYVLISNKEPLEGNVSEYEGYPTNEIIKVGDCTGYIKYSFINASGCSGTDAEKTEIENLLKSGINIEVVETPSEDTGNEDDGF
uniref:Uncharacterized protein n=1 Tax=Podoviridae sp. ctKzN3 TaxID=2826553 RepID=A0A8S5NG07_9CAUD|nr:MAG TPA: hypothetical protein [Podoviridae sp. ctKzN3]